MNVLVLGLLFFFYNFVIIFGDIIIYIDGVFDIVVFEFFDIIFFKSDVVYLF